jgi:arginyl-tRNA--protein-N-Asp/Glu arginylyltransferase
MRLLFSETKPDYAHYVFPYAVWGFPEPGETPADLFNEGFLPSSRALDRFYLCRQVRVNLKCFSPSSENRRILRKGEGIEPRLLERAEFDYNTQRRTFFKNYADIRFGKEVMPLERLDALFGAPITSHVLLFTEANSGAELGTVTLFLQPHRLAYYYYAFYDLNYYARNLGMFMMTYAAVFFAERGFDYLYLGSCYHPNALYKTQFRGAEFFDGLKWSQNLTELKYLLERDLRPAGEHLFESAEYRDLFHEQDLAALATRSRFLVAITKR